jgi:hypothetical protein
VHGRAARMKEEVNVTVRLTPLRLRRLLLAAVVVGAVVTAGVLSPAGARAAVSCTPGAGAQVFLPWNDSRSYVLAPGGDFESPAGWTLAGGAVVGSGNESFYVHARSDSKSLIIPVGGSAVTPSICIDPTQPTLRFWMNGPSAHSGVKLNVDMTYTDQFGNVKTTSMGTINGSRSWDLSHSLGIPQKLASPTVQFRFTVTGRGSASFKLDDVYIDPYIRG